MWISHVFALSTCSNLVTSGHLKPTAPAAWILWVLEALPRIGSSCITNVWMQHVFAKTYRVQSHCNGWPQPILYLMVLGHLPSTPRRKPTIQTLGPLLCFSKVYWCVLQLCWLWVRPALCPQGLHCPSTWAQILKVSAHRAYKCTPVLSPVGVQTLAMNTLSP